MSEDAAAARLVLGCVQLGMPYGRRRGAGLMTEAAAERILSRAWELGIRTLDVAEAYGEAIARVARWIDRARVRAEVRIVTKARVDDPGAIESRVRSAVAGLRGADELTVLSHGAVSGDEWSRFRDAVHRACPEARVGQSVYAPEEVSRAVVQEAARIQAPANVFDLRALEARGSAPTALDLRSAFLQGILLEEEAEAERRAPGSGPLVRAASRAIAAVGVPGAAMLIAVLLHRTRPTDRIVVGVDSANELDAAAAALSVSRSDASRFMDTLNAAPPTFDASVLDPRTWPPGHTNTVTV